MRRDVVLGVAVASHGVVQVHGVPRVAADVALGQSAGVLTVARVGTYPAESLAEAKPDYIIEDLSELPEILIRLAGANDGA